MFGLLLIKNDEKIDISSIIIEDGKIVGIKGIGGADTVIPFNKGGEVKFINYMSSINGNGGQWPQSGNYRFNIGNNKECYAVVLQHNNLSINISGATITLKARINLFYYTLSIYKVENINPTTFGVSWSGAQPGNGLMFGFFV